MSNTENKVVKSLTEDQWKEILGALEDELFLMNEGISYRGIMMEHFPEDDEEVNWERVPEWCRFAHMRLSMLKYQVNKKTRLYNNLAFEVLGDEEYFGTVYWEYTDQDIEFYEQMNITDY